VTNGVFKQPHIIVNNIINGFTIKWLLYVPPLLALQDPELRPQSTYTSHHSEIAFVLCSSLDIIRAIKQRRMRWAGQVARREDRKSVYRVLVGRPDGKRPRGRARRR
jgi:hypothetical protein